MLKTLMRIRMAAIGAWFLSGAGKKRVGKVGYAVLMAVLGAMILFMMFACFMMLAEPFYAAGIGFLYFTLFLMIAFLLMLVGSVFTAKAQLFEAKDNELLLSLPVPPRYILVSRVASLIGINYLYEALVAIPAAVCWVMHCPVTAVGIAAFLLTCLCLPLLATAVSALFGWLLSLLTARIRSKTLFSTLFSLTFLIVYFLGYQKLMNGMTTLAVNGTALAETLGAFQPLYAMSAAISDGNALYLLESLLIMLVPFAVCCFVLSATFIRTVTAQRGAARVEYREKREAPKSAALALFWREGKRFLSSSTYIVNAGLGVFAAVAAAVLLAVKWDDIASALALMDFSAPMLAALLACALCFLSSMTTITAAAVSMEGKHIWIAQSLPVSSWALLRAKLQLHLALMAPAMLVPGVVAVVLLKAAALDALFLILLPQLFTLFLAVLGLAMNLKMPNLNWNNETAAVKNSFAVMIVIFGGWLVTAVPLVLLLAAPATPRTILAAFAAALTVASLLLLHWLKTRGAVIFETL